MAKEEVITEDLECADPVLATKASSSDGLPLAEAEPVVDERTFLSELPFIAVVASGQLMAQAQTGSCFLPVRLIGEALGTQEPGELSWTAASYGLTLGVFVLITGQLGDRFGSKNIFVLGFILSVIVNIGSAFCTSTIPFDICRALAGVGAAMILPNSSALLGRAYPPGALRTISFSILGALAPAGFVIGAVMGSLIMQTLSLRWLYIITALACAVFAVLSMLMIPSDRKHSLKAPYIDYFGFVLAASGLILLNFSWNQAPLVGWSTPYIYGCFIASILVLCAFGAWSVRMKEKALVAPNIFNRQTVAVLCALWFGWMSIRDARGLATPLGVSAEMTTLAPSGITSALVLIWVFPRLASHYIFAISMFCFCLANVLMAATPIHQSYWKMLFPALLCVGPGPDFSFASASLIVSHSVPQSQQGVAGGLVFVIVNYSVSLGLGMSGTVEHYITGGATDLDSVLAGYKSAFYFATGLAALGLAVVAVVVRDPSIKGKGH